MEMHPESMNINENPLGIYPEGMGTMKTNPERMVINENPSQKSENQLKTIPKSTGITGNP